MLGNNNYLKVSWEISKRKKNRVKYFFRLEVCFESAESNSRQTLVTEKMRRERRGAKNKLDTNR